MPKHTSKKPSAVAGRKLRALQVENTKLKKKAKK